MNRPQTNAMGANEMAAARAAGGQMEQQAEQEQQMKAQEEQMKEQMAQVDGVLQKTVDVEAMKKIGAVAAVKPEKAQQLKMMLVQLIEQGQMKPPISVKHVEDLMTMWESKYGTKAVVINYQRKAFSDSESDLDLDDMDAVLAGVGSEGKN